MHTCSLPYNSGFLCVLSATGPELVFAGQSLSQISVPSGTGTVCFIFLSASFGILSDT